MSASVSSSSSLSDPSQELSVSSSSFSDAAPAEGTVFVQVQEWLDSSPENQRCADCGSADPRWASINLGVSVCIECSGVHRHLGVHVSKPRSLLLDSWPAEMWAEFVGAGGNATVNAVYEASVPAGYTKPAAGATRAQRDDWIQKKYAARAFVEGNTTAPLSAADAARLAIVEEADNVSATAMREYRGMITVTVLEGKDLMPKDLNGFSDPYVILRLGSQEVKTKIKKKTLNPVWNEKLMLCVCRFGEVCEISVFDWDKMSSDDSLGTARVPITHEMEREGGVHRWIDLDDATTGALHCKFEYTALAH